MIPLGYEFQKLNFSFKKPI